MGHSPGPALPSGRLGRGGAIYPGTPLLSSARQTGFASWHLRIAEGQRFHEFVAWPEVLVLNPGLIAPNHREQMQDLGEAGSVGAGGLSAGRPGRVLADARSQAGGAR